MKISGNFPGIFSIFSPAFSNVEVCFIWKSEQLDPYELCNCSVLYMHPLLSSILSIFSTTGIIKHGGEKPNIIPAYTELQFYLRTPLVKDLCDLKAKAEACFRAAAVATGCQVSLPKNVVFRLLPSGTNVRTNSRYSWEILFEVDSAVIQHCPF